MIDSNKLSLEKIIELTRSSEKKYQQGNFKAAIQDKRQVRTILNSDSVDMRIIEKFKDELSNLYDSKFDLIYDHKLRLSELKKNEIVKFLEKKCDEKFSKGEFKAAIRALRRSEKYLSN